MHDALNVSTPEANDGSRFPRSLRRAAMDCLARREHSFFELKQKLQRKFPERDPEEIQREVERLREENLQSDRRFTEAFVRNRKVRGYGYPIIREELRRRFVSDTLIDHFLHVDDDEWSEILTGLIAKRMQRDGKLDFGSKQHRRLLRFLQQRGFGQAEIQDSLGPYMAGENA